MNIKELPVGLNLKWEEPGVPPGRHLSTDIMPISEFSRMRKRIGGRSAFKPKTNFDTGALDELRKDPVMDKLGEDYIFSSFTMEPDSLLFLKEVIQMFQPRMILELGCGLSTLILSAAQKSVLSNGSGTKHYVCLEQDEEVLDATKAHAEKAGVSGLVEFLHTPLVRYKIGAEFSLDEKAMPCFDFDEGKLHVACGGVRPDMIIIDGPADEKTMSGASFAKTLSVPILNQYASANAAYFMDECYNDPEIFAMEQWQESGSASIVGVKAVGKGMMIGLKPLQQ